ncbi:LacI family DNA-binding transcriptional regulator [Erwinia pyri]|uniref:LacI family DNA-binding transcriptional regulator n=1 Tax=Erwinia pyri TaxID=3062598 RepID=A0AA50DP30_9GAMM|nr:LacI family DNA-binding transcriptional regulator [Erwinia sp. DE2]WLS80747.1 LacI family DNA-binding transcriptional regulator [Erwinia sp. DE2]
MNEKASANRPVLRKITASDVARRAGVSKWTVSRAFTDGASISEQALARVQLAAKELGYRPNLLARSLSKKSSRLIGVVVDEMLNPNLLTLLDQVTQQLQLRGYMALLLNISAQQSEEAVLKLADQLQVDGLLFLGTLLSDDLIALAQDIHRIPLVQLCRNDDNPYIQVINTDGYRAGGQAADLLYQQGYQRFGYMKGPDTESTQLLRYEGYRDRLKELGVEEQSILLLKANHYNRISGYTAFEQHLQTTLPGRWVDALFCENDILAIGVTDARESLASHHHLGIVGYDDIELASSARYQLTTFAQPLNAMMQDALLRLTGSDRAQPDFQHQDRLLVRRSHLRSAFGDEQQQ